MRYTLAWRRGKFALTFPTRLGHSAFSFPGFYGNSSLKGNALFFYPKIKFTKNILLPHIGLFLAINLYHAF